MKDVHDIKNYNAKGKEKMGKDDQNGEPPFVVRTFQGEKQESSKISNKQTTIGSFVMYLILDSIPNLMVQKLCITIVS